MNWYQVTGCCFVVAVVIACAPSQSERQPPSNPSSETNDERPVTEAPRSSAGDAEPLQVSVLVVGLERYEVPTAEARQKNREALAQHRGGHYGRSLAGFEAAITESEGFSKARYNRACALSKLGRVEEAAAAIEPLLEEDLPNYGPRLETDDVPTGVRLMTPLMTPASVPQCEC